MLRSALNNAELFQSKNAEPIKTETLEKLAKEYFLAESIIDRLSRMIAPEVLHALLKHPEISLDGEKQATQSAAQLQQVCGTRIAIDAENDPTEDGYRLKLTKYQHGNYSITYINHEFIQSGDYAQIKQTAQAIGGLIGQGAYIKRGEQHKPVTDFKQAIEWLLEEAKRGVSIQRYKGLGEMNPEQLWETTMDSKNRRLLRVQIEDMIAADEIFTTLMGDVVEPRRAFIEQNALGAKNLDV
jgi:DNA gyrase subunit B